MQFSRSSLLLVAMVAGACAMFDHGPKYGSHPFKPVYLNPYGSKYESYGKYNDEHKDSHYQPTYYHDSYEPKYGGHEGAGASAGGHGNDYYSSYQPSHQPYYGSAYYNEQPKYNDYHATQNYYDKY